MNVGLIGLGVMGLPMAKNLLKAGYTVYAFDALPPRTALAAQAGARPCQSVEEACQSCREIITMLPDGPQVRQVALGPGGIGESAAPGTLLVDMSSIAPGVSREVAAALAPRGITMLDAPVSGGESGAVQGTLAIMAGGSQEDFHRARPLFDVLGASACLVGDIGSGNVCKLANQVMVAGHLAALSEGLLLAKMAGADPEKVFAAIRGGLAGSAVMEAKAPKMLAGDYAPGFRIQLHIKDLRNALATGEATGAPLPLAALVQEMFQALDREGAGGLDHSALVRRYEELAGSALREAGEK